VGRTRAPYSPRLSRSDVALIPYAAQPRDGQGEEALGIYRCMTAELIAYHLEEPVQSIRNRLQRMYKHGFCRRYGLGTSNRVTVWHHRCGATWRHMPRSEPNFGANWRI
jgi:hypothetical protein